MILSFYSKSEYSVNRKERVLQKMFMMQSADRIFRRGDILIPKGNLDKWAVVACDQFSSDIPYWEDVERIGLWDLEEEYQSCTLEGGFTWSVRIIYKSKELNSYGANMEPKIVIGDKVYSVLEELYKSIEELIDLE